MVISDIFSHYDREYRYANRFDEVIVIRQNEHVVIVENKKGSRFSCNVNMLIQVSDGVANKLSSIISELKYLTERQSTSANTKRINALELNLKQVLNS